MNKKLRTVDLKTLGNVTGGAAGTSNWSQDWKAPAASWNSGSTAWNSGAGTSWKNWS
jgi:hypothetical protein